MRARTVMEHFAAFHDPDGELLPPFADLKSDKADVHRCAEIIQQLDFICAQVSGQIRWWLDWRVDDVRHTRCVMRTRALACFQTLTCTHAHIHTRAHTHALTHTHTHTHTHMH